MTIYRLVKVASTVAILGLAPQIQAHEGEDHGAVATTTSATPAMDHSAMAGTTSTDGTTVGSDPLLLENITKNVKSGAISGGVGINYVGKFIYDNKMTKFDMAKGLFGTDLTVINQPNGFPGFAGDKHASEAITIPPLRSMSWNNTQSNPDDPTTTDLAKGFGSGVHSQWYLVDLSKLSSGKYYVSIKLERYDDGQAVEVIPATATTAEQTLPSDDDLVPAITVFDGYQNRGISGTWFPNQFQTTTTPFWAEMLKPESVLLGANSAKAGFDTAFGASANDRAQVSGVIKLDSAGKVAKTNRYLTIAIGGDDRTTKHDVNYQLTVKVHSCVGAPCGSN
ncbi:MAG: hypothetical protein PHC99_09440 [Methylococcales bacterium]|nr:hypothetical protein [Methylococcales bacterium]